MAYKQCNILLLQEIREYLCGDDLTMQLTGNQARLLVYGNHQNPSPDYQEEGIDCPAGLLTVELVVLSLYKPELAAAQLNADEP